MQTLWDLAQGLPQPLVALADADAELRQPIVVVDEVHVESVLLSVHRSPSSKSQFKMAAVGL